MIYSAYLFGVRSFDSELVLVPLNSGAITFASIDDLDVSYWIQPGMQVVNVRNHAARRVRFDIMPGTNERLTSSFTVYFQSQLECSRRNHVIDEMLAGRSMWKGTVLVVKHGVGEDVVDMVRSDAPIVKHLVVA